MTRATPMITALLVACLLLAAGPARAADRLVLGVPLQPSAALLHLAHLEGFFQDQGLEVTIRTYPSGKRALLDGLFQDRVDVTVASDIPLVVNSFTRDDFVALAAINYLDDVNSIVAHRDAGIAAPGDLKGKRFGIQRASAVHYFADLFLEKHFMTEEDVEAVYMNGAEFPRAIADGEIDAFSMREPFVSQAVARLGDNAVVFTAPGLYPQYDIVIADRTFVAENPGAIHRLLRALLAARDHAEAHPDQAIARVAAYLEADPRAVADAWDSFSLEVSLDQAMVVALENAAEWAIANDLTAAKSIPNYLDFIHFDALESLSPRAVTIIH